METEKKPSMIQNADSSGSSRRFMAVVGSLFLFLSGVGTIETAILVKITESFWPYLAGLAILVSGVVFALFMFNLINREDIAALTKTAVGVLSGNKDAELGAIIRRMGNEIEDEGSIHQNEEKTQ